MSALPESGANRNPIEGVYKMKKTYSVLFALSLALALPLSAVETPAATDATPKKERNFRGELSCAKCTLKKAESCQAALTIKRKTKNTDDEGNPIIRTVVRMLKNNQAAKDFHGNICAPNKKVAVKVTGVLEGEKKNRIIVASKIAKVVKKKANTDS